MKKPGNVLLDFSHVYGEEFVKQLKNVERVDLSDIEGTDMYCTKEAEAEIRKRLQPYGPEGIHFLDNGNYHYVTRLFTDKIKQPFSLFLFDHHSDMQQPMIHELTSCGSWAGEMLRENPNLKQLILIGPNPESIEETAADLKEKVICISMQEIETRTAGAELLKIRMDLPAYISMDKDVLDHYCARTNWNQGRMSMDTLKKLLSEVFLHQKVIGVDLCGECSLAEPLQQLLEDEKINEATDKILYQFFSSYLFTADN